MAEDKQFEATPRKKQKERSEGNVLRSRDLTSAGVLLLAMLTAPPLFRLLARTLATQTAHSLAHLHEFKGTAEELTPMVVYWWEVFTRTLGPLLLVIVGGAILFSALQSGLVFSPKVLHLKWSRLNPAQALKRIFSLRGLVETLKSLLKLTLIAYTAVVVLRGQWDQVMTLGQLEPGEGFALAAKIAGLLALKTSAVMVLLGAADYGYQRYEYNRNLRMTREEMKQEGKDTEGDPLVRSQRQRRRQQLLRDGLSPHLPQAQVVITNPTRLAIALLYEPGVTEAPLVVARGRGRLARRIRQLAHRHGVPLRENPPLARALYQSCSLGTAIPQSLFQAVALILAQIYREAEERRHRHQQRWQQGAATDYPPPGVKA